jgi:hypothetical protein
MSDIPQPNHFNRKPIVAAILGGIVAVSSAQVLTAGANLPAAKNPVLMLAASTNPCNPCAAKNPCNPCNPCAAKKACNPCNPCAAKKACNPCNPCAAKNPCAAGACNPCNPCGAAKIAARDFMRPVGFQGVAAATPALVSEGKSLWNDTSLSTNGLSCQSCHANNALLNPTFAQPYPHKIAMTSQMAGVGPVYLDEMVQFCMVVPMQAKPLKWGSRELAAITAYAGSLQAGFNPCQAKKSPCNPCNPCNPCAAKKACSPCNPCAAKNPCSPCNPCNPCAVKNPCKAS